MPAPTLTALPPPPTRANPADFSARADSFLGALPTLVTQINALVTYWNAELDTTAFVNRAQATTITGTMTYTTPPVLLASGTSGRQTAFTIGKGSTQRQSVGIENDGTINIVPLNGAIAALALNGNRVFTTAYLPTPAQIGALPASAYTAADVLAKLQSITGGSGSTLDAATLAGQNGSFYRNAGNLNAGTVPDARLPTNIVRSTRRVNSGDGLSGGAALTGDVNLSVDSSVARRNAQNEYTGNQLFNSGSIYVGASSSTNAHIWFQTIGGVMRGLIWGAPASDIMRYRSYTSSGNAYREFSFNGANGVLSSPEFAGGGENLSRLNAGALDRGIIPDARIGSNFVRTSRTINTGGGLQGGRSLAGDMTLSVDATVVRTTRAISAGNGLSGGGNLEGNIAISLGTPGSITADSANSVSSTSHTHSLSRAAVLELISRSQVGEVGTYGAFKRSQSGIRSPGNNVPGSELIYSAFDGATNGTSPTGTWKCMGYVTSYNGETNPNNASLFLRIA